MSAPLIIAEEVRLKPDGRSLSVTIAPGEAYAVTGPAGGGADELFQALSGASRPFGGKVRTFGRGGRSAELRPTRRSTPLSLCRESAGASERARVAEVLSALGLWDCRKTLWTRLPPELQEACALAPALASGSDWLALDRGIDRLDPWTMDAALDMLTRRTKEGVALIVRTNRLDLAERFGRLIVVSQGEPVFAGTCDAVRQLFGPSELLVQTKDASTVRCMVDPLAVSVRVVRGGLVVSTAKGQETAAKLLTQGYGSVKAVVVREPTLTESVLSLIFR